MGAVLSNLPSNNSIRGRISNILQSPRQGDFIDFWCVRLDTSEPSLDHVHLTYYDHLAWSSSYLGKRNPGTHGASLDHEWTVEHEVASGWETSGRADTSWVSHRLQDEYVFITEALAKLCLRGALEERLDNLHAEAAHLEASLLNL